MPKIWVFWAGKSGNFIFQKFCYYVISYISILMAKTSDDFDRQNWYAKLVKEVFSYLYSFLDSMTLIFIVGLPYRNNCCSCPRSSEVFCSRRSLEPPSSTLAVSCVSRDVSIDNNQLKYLAAGRFGLKLQASGLASWYVLYNVLHCLQHLKFTKL